MNVEDRIRSLGNNVSPIREACLGLLSEDQSFHTKGDVVYLSHRPQIAPEAFAVVLYPPLATSLIETYERIQGLNIPSTYQRVLMQLNGIHIFDLSLLGIPPSMAQTPPTIDRSTLQPHDLAAANRYWRTPYRAPETFFMVGTSHWSHTENVAYFLRPDDGVTAYLEGSSPASWPSLADFLTSEIARSRQFYTSRLPG